MGGVTFTDLVTGVYTTSLRLDPTLVTQKYELTSPQTVTVTLSGCQCDVVCISPACESKCRCNGEASVKLGIRRRTELILTKVDDPDPVMAGGQLTYTIAVANIGSAPATDVIIRDKLDSNLFFVAAGPSCLHDGLRPDGNVTCPVGVIAPGVTITRTVSVTVSNAPIPCLITNTVTVTGHDGSAIALAATTTTTTTVQPGITVRACEDRDADGDCGPESSPLLNLAGVQACLTNGVTNDDGRVDLLDLSTVATSFGQTGPDLPADVNGDGQVNIFFGPVRLCNPGNSA